MRNSQHIFNWANEAEAIRSFLVGTRSVLHVFAGHSSQPDQFLNLVERIAQEIWAEDHRICRVDHVAMPTSTPAAVLSHIAETLGLPDMKENNGRAVGGNYMSDLRSLRDITISGNQITITSGADVEHLTFLLRTFCQAAKTDLDLSKNVVLVQACETLTVEEKRAFGRNVWESALCPLLPAGLKVVFSFNPDDVGEGGCTWPPPRDAVLQLPSFFDASKELVQQIGEWLIAHGHASTVEAARESAKMLLASSRTVSDLYGRLALLEITGHAGCSAK